MGKQKFNFQLNQSTTPVSSTAETQSPPQTDTDTVASIVQRLDNNDKNPFDIKLIPRNRIRANKKNNYPIEEIESLAKSILEYGLQQNLVVVYSAEEDIYIIETGHRRVTALDMLIDKYSDATESPEYELYKKNVAPFEKGYPCKVIYLEDGIQYDVSDDTDLSNVPISVIDSEIRLYITNEEVRTKTPALTAQAVARLRKLYNAKNAMLNRANKINVNKEIAEDLSLSSRQVAKYNATESLIPELKGLFISNNITLNDAAGYAQLTPAEQMQIYQLFKEHDDLSNKQIDDLIKANNELNRQIKQQETKISSLSSDSDELAELKTQIKTLKEQQRSILSENSELKQKMLITRNLKSTYDDLLAVASRFIHDAEKVSEISCSQTELEKAVSLLNQLSSLSIF